MTAELQSWSRDVAPVDYLLYRAEVDPRSRSSIMSVEVLDQVPDWDRLREDMDRASRVVPRLRQRIVAPVLPIARAQWVVDPDFDLGYHMRRVRVPEPGTLRQVLDLAQSFYATPLDMSPPLVGGDLDRGRRRRRRTGGAAVEAQPLHHGRPRWNRARPPDPLIRAEPCTGSDATVARPRRHGVHRADAPRRQKVAVHDRTRDGSKDGRCRGGGRACAAPSARRDQRCRSIRRIVGPHHGPAAGRAVAAASPAQPQPPVRDPRRVARRPPMRGQGQRVLGQRRVHRRAVRCLAAVPRAARPPGGRRAARHAGEPSLG